MSSHEPSSAEVTASSGETASAERFKRSCNLCAKRKVKCNRIHPCERCLKSQVECVFDKGPTVYRPRKKVHDQGLLVRLQQYERLLEKNNVDYSSCSTTWVKDEGPQANSRGTVDESAEPNRPKPSVHASGSLWWQLPRELKYPVVQIIRNVEDIKHLPDPSFQTILSNSQHDHLSSLHPPPDRIFLLWQTFLSKVDPLTKVIHAPSVQQQVLNISSAPSAASPSLVALLFSIYTSAVTSLTSQQCLDLLGSSRDDLLVKYRDACLRALVHADFLVSRDLTTLQAFVLFLISNPQLELSTTLIGAAMSLARKMNIGTPNPQRSFFETEMSIRLCWQLRGLNARMHFAAISGERLPSPKELIGDIRMPLNVNDADLHPNMRGPPAEQSGPTEMVAVLIKYESTHWFRTNAVGAKIFSTLNSDPGKYAPLLLTDADYKAIQALGELYQEKYFRKLDSNIPLHRVALALGRLSVSRLQLKLHHPKWVSPPSSNNAVHLSSETDQMLFEASLQAMQSVNEGLHSQFVAQLFTMLLVKFAADCLVYVLSGLRVRVKGEQVDAAWAVVEQIYDGHLLHEQTDNLTEGEAAFYSHLGDLTLQAWDARWAQLCLDQRGQQTRIPEFVQSLRKQRRLSDGVAMSLDTDLETFLDDLDQDHWQDFLAW